jgi:hypothetical protein
LSFDVVAFGSVQFEFVWWFVVGFELEVVFAEN